MYFLFYSTVLYQVIIGLLEANMRLVTDISQLVRTWCVVLFRRVSYFPRRSFDAVKIERVMTIGSNEYVFGFLFVIHASTEGFICKLLFIDIVTFPNVWVNYESRTRRGQNDPEAHFPAHCDHRRDLQRDGRRKPTRRHSSPQGFIRTRVRTNHIMI